MSAPSWFLRPNWNSSVKVTYQFKTDIIVSRANNEQRRMLRATPRKTIEFQATSLRVVDTAAFHRYIATFQPQSLYVPEWPALVRPTATLTAGSNTFTADRAIPNWLTAGLTLIIATRDNSFQAVVDTVDIGSRVVTLLTNADVDYAPVMTRICPMRAAYFPDSMKLTRALDLAADSTIAFEVEETSEPAVTPAAPFFVFEGTEVFLEKPDWSSPLDEELTWARELVDAGFGPVKRYTPGPRQVRGLRATYWQSNNAYAFFLLDFFLRMRGQQGEFLMPTWEQDILPGYDIAAGDSFLREVGTSLADAWVRGWPYTTVMVETDDGTRYFRRVVEIHSVTDDLGTDSIVTLDTPIADAVALADIVRVSWVPTWRFASDEITIEWKSDEAGTIAMAFQTIETIQGDAPAPPTTAGRIIFLRSSTTSPFIAPSDLDPTFPVVVHGIGAGQGGGMGLLGAFVDGISGEAGAGGGYSVLPALTVAPGDSFPFQVGQASGSTTPGAYAGPDGPATRFGIGLGAGGADLLYAEGGHLDIGTGAPTGGRASVAIPPTNAQSGGSGGLNSTSFLAGPGGGGAAGPNGDGGSGVASSVGGGGSGGGGANGGSDGLPGAGAGVGGDGGASGATAGGLGLGPGDAGNAGANGSGGGGGGGENGLPGGAGGAGGTGIVLWTETATGLTAGPGGGGGGGGGGSAATDGGAGGNGGQYGGGGGGGGCGTTDAVGEGGTPGGGLIVFEYTATTG